MATVCAMTLEVKTFQSRGSFADCGLLERRRLGVVAAPVLTCVHVVHIISHRTDLEDFASLYRELPNRQQVSIRATIRAPQPIFATVKKRIRGRFIAVKGTFVFEVDLDPRGRCG